RAALRPILLRFIILAPLITLAAWLFVPDDFLSFPRRAPERWLMVMLLYPLLSVWPQEVIYRAFMHVRYAPLWGTGKGYIVASALAFGYMHIIFLNAPAVIMTAALGLILARDYARHRSLALVCVEHALYGCLIFTVGLGSFFYSGAAWGGG
ncbi:MAG: CPBP family intramembrane metalloprotease, partial [Alphaproteobacteria bacterium]|nr:CPBP family intramembrane metalloprotease [Alphaproteobacteria bacterium]